jgi:hypothetical protein
MKHKYVAVEWLDACDHAGINYYKILNGNTKEYLVKRVSYGMLLLRDNDGVVILTDKDEDDKCEITTIPKQWIRQVRVLK